MNEIELRAIKKLVKLYEETITVMQDENAKMKRVYREMIDLMEGEEKLKQTEEGTVVKDLIQKMMLLKEIIGI
ncbi:MAG: hypothetical protein ACXQS6_01400 [Candidatus Syntropharchaeales archaeon]|nr:hypothetical protein [Candidatus Syntrophoarchaeum sp.]